MDSNVEGIVARAVGGEKIPPEELLPLFDLETQSAEVAHIRWAACVIGQRPAWSPDSGRSEKPQLSGMFSLMDSSGRLSAPWKAGLSLRKIVENRK